MKRSRLRQVSIKRRAELKEYTQLRKLYLRQNPACEICDKRRSIEVNHKAGREGKKLLDQTFWLAVCRTCHDWIHDNPKEAREKNYKL